MRRAGLLALLAALGPVFAARAHTAGLALRPAFAGAVLEGRVTAAGEAELTGVWSAQGRARLLRCAPRCVTVPAIPLQGTLLVNGDTPYRVALGGTFVPGRRVKLTLQFRGAELLNVDAPVRRP